MHISLKHKWKDTFNSFCNLWANTGSRRIENFVRKYQVVHDLVCSCVSDLYSLGMWFRRQIFRINLGCVFPYSKMNILAGPKLSQAAHGSPSPGTAVSCKPLRWWCIGKESPADAGDAGSIPELGRSLKEGNGSWTKDQTCVSCIGRWILYHWATREAPLTFHLPYIPQPNWAFKMLTSCLSST